MPSSVGDSGTANADGALFVGRRLRTNVTTRADREPPGHFPCCARCEPRATAATDDSRAPLGWSWVDGAWVAWEDRAR